MSNFGSRHPAARPSRHPAARRERRISVHTKHIVHMVLGVALLLTGLANIIVPSADAEPGTFSAQAPVPLPTPETEGTIVITKQSGDGQTIAGSTFTAKRVLTIGGEAVDLTTQAGWDLLDRIGLWAPTPEEALNHTLLAVPVNQVLTRGTFAEPALEATTNAAGEAEFTKVGAGLYLIQDVSPSGPKAETILVTLPYPDPASNRWLNQAGATPKPTVEPTPPVCRPVADLAADIWIEDNRTQAYVGEELTYDFVVANLGPEDSLGSSVQITLDPGLKVISENFPDEFDPATYIWTVPALRAGEVITLRVLVRIIAVGTHAATMLITANCDPDLSNNYYDPVIEGIEPGPPGPTPTPTAPTPTPTPTVPGVPTPPEPSAEPRASVDGSGRPRSDGVAAVETPRTRQAAESTSTPRRRSLWRTGIEVFAIVAGAALAFTGYLALRRNRRRAET